MNWLQRFLLLGVGWIVYYLHNIVRHLSTIERLLDGQTECLAKIDAAIQANLKQLAFAPSATKKRARGDFPANALHRVKWDPSESGSRGSLQERPPLYRRSDRRYGGIRPESREKHPLFQDRSAFHVPR